MLHSLFLIRDRFPGLMVALITVFFKRNSSQADRAIELSIFQIFVVFFFVQTTQTWWSINHPILSVLKLLVIILISLFFPCKNCFSDMPRCHSSTVCHWHSKGTALWQQSRVQATGQSLGWWNGWSWWTSWQKSDMSFISCFGEPPLEACDISRCISKVCRTRQSKEGGQHILHLWPCSCTAVSTSSTSALLSAIFRAVCPTPFLWVPSGQSSTPLSATSLWCFFHLVTLVQNLF